ncbi:DUF320 domain-containing protein [Actinomadura craniellae]|uniref:DUF320 domain-containing protein n=1 Tax=Actinomadura craniellae TaxID=2231787 RepID=A0A365H8E7_9ACTN|nr:DUF320 domain-containing protein [Actinomadura craniellae]RAY15351.1 DUF320 domain-containing protein [Actinomadura craniellae]
MLKKLTLTGAVAAAAYGMTLGGTPAAADINILNGSLNRNQVVAPVSVPVNVCGVAVNAVTVVGLSGAHCKGGAGTVTPFKVKQYH